MMNKYTIYIPSRKRYEKNLSLTANELLNDNINFKLVVEPQDKINYKNIFNNKVLVMDKNDMGIAYARNWIKQYSIDHKEAYHWQIDDNIKNFKIRKNNKNIKIEGYKNLKKAEEYVNQYNNIGAAGLKHAMFAWAAKNKIDFNKQVYTCVLFNNKPNIWWRDGLVEDTDYSLQLLTEGYCTLIFNRLIMDKVTTMTIKGGNTEISYEGDRRLIRAQGLQSMWPGIFKLGEQYGRVKVRPSQIWRTFKQRPGDTIIRKTLI